MEACGWKICFRYCQHHADSRVLSFLRLSMCLWSLCPCVCVCVIPLAGLCGSSSPIQARTSYLGQKMHTINPNLQFTHFWASPRRNSPCIQVRISKSGPKMHLKILMTPFNFGTDWCLWNDPRDFGNTLNLIFDFETYFSTKMIKWYLRYFGIYPVRPGAVFKVTPYTGSVCFKPRLIDSLLFNETYC